MTDPVPVPRELLELLTDAAISRANCARSTTERDHYMLLANRGKAALLAPVANLLNNPVDEKQE
jgi:hypothetical protein